MLPVTIFAAKVLKIIPSAEFEAPSWIFSVCAPPLVRYAPPQVRYAPPVTERVPLHSKPLCKNSALRRGAQMICPH